MRRRRPPIGKTNGDDAGRDEHAISLFGCAAPTSGFTIPVHWSVTVTGTATFGGRSFNFSETVEF